MHVPTLVTGKREAWVTHTTNVWTPTTVGPLVWACAIAAHAPRAIAFSNGDAKLHTVPGDNGSCHQGRVAKKNTTSGSSAAAALVPLLR